IRTAAPDTPAGAAHARLRGSPKSPPPAPPAVGAGWRRGGTTRGGVAGLLGASATPHATARAVADATPAWDDPCARDRALPRRAYCISSAAREARLWPYHRHHAQRHHHGRGLDFAALRQRGCGAMDMELLHWRHQTVAQRCEEAQRLTDQARRVLTEAD